MITLALVWYALALSFLAILAIEQDYLEIRDFGYATICGFPVFAPVFIVLVVLGFIADKGDKVIWRRGPSQQERP